MNRIRAGALLLILSFVFTPQTAALAETQQHSALTWAGKRCAWGQTWVSSDWAWPGLESIATINSGPNCGDPNWTTRPGEGIGIRQTLVGWDARGFAFECNVGAWQYEWRVGFHERRTWWAFNRPCNTFWYRGEGFPAVYYDNDWHFGSLTFGHGIKTGWIAAN